MFNRHKQVENSFDIDLLHLLCGSCGDLISKDVLWELELIVLFNSILLHEINTLLNNRSGFKYNCKI